MDARSNPQIIQLTSVEGNYQSPKKIVRSGTYQWSASEDSFICPSDVTNVAPNGITETAAVDHYCDAKIRTYCTYVVIMNWDQTTGFVTENVLEGKSQRYICSVETENVGEDAETETKTCSQETGIFSRGRTEIRSIAASASTPVKGFRSL
jgi:hypothetical protein